jgi:hypothetical protein
MSGSARTAEADAPVREGGRCPADAFGMDKSETLPLRSERPIAPYEHSDSLLAVQCSAAVQQISSPIVYLFGSAVLSVRLFVPFALLRPRRSALCSAVVWCGVVWCGVV